MNGDEILAVLREIRDEAKETNVRLESLEGRVEQTNVRLESLEGRVEQTNVRLESLEGRVEQTNVRLESLEGRTDFLERRVTKGFETFTDQFAAFADRLDGIARQQAESEMRLASEVVGLTEVTRRLHDVIVRKLEDHDAVIDLQARVKVLEELVIGRDE
jgi:chromosome segregation ATPase